METHRNTIEPTSISGEEYVIIKNLKKEYVKKKNIIIQRIFNEIKKNHLKDNKENNLE